MLESAMQVKMVYLRTKFTKIGLVFCVVCLLSSCAIFNPAPQLTPIPTALPPSQTPDAAEMQTQLLRQATSTPKPTATAWPLATSTVSSTDLPFYPRGVNPLTGLLTEDLNLLDLRPMLVKVANWPQSLRPSNQLNQADIVFEYYIGHQTNHLAALYYGVDAELVGPLAPGRVVDTRLAEHYQANLVIASADSSVQRIFDRVLADRNFRRGYAPCPGICTETDAQGGNTVVDTAAMRAYIAEEFGPAPMPHLEGLLFSRSVPAWDEEAQRLSYLYADFSVMDWRYDKDTGAYQLWQDYSDENGNISLKPAKDRDTNTPIAFQNIIILFANYIRYTDSYYDIDMKEGNPNQKGLLLRDGKLFHLSWNSQSPESPFIFYDPDGNLLALKPGRSWITFASVNSKTVRTGPDSWDLIFSVN